MTSKWIGSACVVGGTAIGSGVLVLPVVCAKVSLLSGFLLMFFSWLVSYWTALVALELNLQAGSGHTLGELGQRFSGRCAALFGTGSVKLLCTVLFAAYLCGIAETVQGLLQAVNIKADAFQIKSFAAVLFVVFLSSGVARVEKWNRLFFLGVGILLLGVIALLGYSFPSIRADVQSMNFSGIVLKDMSILTVLFTSFGFQVVFHTLTDYCERDKEALKKAFFWGSFIPFLFYFFWTFGALYVVAHISGVTYAKLIQGSAGLSDLMNALTGALLQSNNWLAGALMRIFRSGLLFLFLSFLAILTSMVGVGLGLLTSWLKVFAHKESFLWRSVPLVLTVFPSWVMAVVATDFFIGFLSVAGCVLACIAIFLPLILLRKQRKMQSKSVVYYPLVDSSLVQAFSWLWGILVVLAETKVFDRL